MNIHSSMNVSFDASTSDPPLPPRAIGDFIESDRIRRNKATKTRRPAAAVDDAEDTHESGRVSAKTVPTLKSLSLRRAMLKRRAHSDRSVDDRKRSSKKTTTSSKRGLLASFLNFRKHTHDAHTIVTDGEPSVSVSEKKGGDGTEKEATGSGAAAPVSPTPTPLRGELASELPGSQDFTPLSEGRLHRISIGGPADRSKGTVWVKSPGDRHKPFLELNVAPKAPVASDDEKIKPNFKATMELGNTKAGKNQSPGLEKVHLGAKKAGGKYSHNKKTDDEKIKKTRLIPLIKRKMRRRGIHESPSSSRSTFSDEYKKAPDGFKVVALVPDEPQLPPLVPLESDEEMGASPRSSDTRLKGNAMPVKPLLPVGQDEVQTPGSSEYRSKGGRLVHKSAMKSPLPSPPPLYHPKEKKTKQKKRGSAVGNRSPTSPSSRAYVDLLGLIGDRFPSSVQPKATNEDLDSSMDMGNGAGVSGTQCSGRDDGVYLHGANTVRMGSRTSSAAHVTTDDGATAGARPPKRKPSSQHKKSTVSKKEAPAGDRKRRKSKVGSSRAGQRTDAGSLENDFLSYANKLDRRRYRELQEKKRHNQEMEWIEKKRAKWASKREKVVYEKEKLALKFELMEKYGYLRERGISPSRIAVQFPVRAQWCFCLLRVTCPSCLARRALNACDHFPRTLRPGNGPVLHGR